MVATVHMGENVQLTHSRLVVELSGVAGVKLSRHYSPCRYNWSQAEAVPLRPLYQPKVVVGKD